MAGIEWVWWDRIVLFMILLNTIQLALYDPFDIPQLKPESRKRDIMNIVNQYAMFTFSFCTLS